MIHIKRFSFTPIVTLIAMLVVSVQAQTPRITAVNIAPDSDRVRVSAIGDVSEIRIEVVSEAGDIVFESGVITGQQLDWNMSAPFIRELHVSN